MQTTTNSFDRHKARSPGAAALASVRQMAEAGSGYMSVDRHEVRLALAEAASTNADLLAACEAIRMTATPGAPDGYVLIPVSAHGEVLAAIAKAKGGAK